MADEPSTRGLVEGDLGPLRRFTGILDSMPKEPQTYGEGEAARTTQRVKLNCKDIDVKEAVEPYHFPIYTITISESNKKKSRWGVLSEGTPEDRSIGFNNVADQKLTPEQHDPSNANYVKPADRLEIKHCIGKRLGFVMTDGEDGRPKATDLYDGRIDADRPTPAWTVYEIEGVGVAGGQGTSAMEVAMSKLDGKTLADFNTAALADPVIRNDTALLAAIGMPPTAPNSFANTMVSTGKFTKDEASGVFSKVVAAA
ncbi:MAG: hypothetical protein KAY32_15450 [Candidatus Eisenbacteria sp.]|nr:hypothetical protein [Candidatus Eisenbacteria bacterium]